MPAAPEIWTLTHPDERTLTITRQREHYVVDEVAWAETGPGGQWLRKGAWARGQLASRPAEEIANLLARFEAEGFTLTEVKTFMPVGALALLHEIDTLDTGAGIACTPVRGDRWQLAGSTTEHRARHFHPLDQAGVIEIRDGADNHVRINQTGRTLARHIRDRSTAAAR